MYRSVRIIIRYFLRFRNRFFPGIPYQRKDRYCTRMRVQQRDFADASHSKSAKSATTTVSYGIFSSENAYPCTATPVRSHTTA